MRKSFCLFLLFLLMVFGAKLSAQEITYYTGFWKVRYFEDNKEITKKEVKSLLETNAEAWAYAKKSDRDAIVASILLTAEIGFAIWGGIEIGQDNGDPLVPVIGTVATFISGIIFASSANKNVNKAIRTYNQQFDAKTSFRLVPVSNGNGLGLALQF